MKTEKIIITTADIKLVENCSQSTANRRYLLLLDSLGKTKLQKVTVSEYANWVGIEIDLINKIIN